MREAIEYKIKKNRQAAKRRTAWISGVSILSAVTAFFTVNALTKTATTQEAESFCGYEEHIAHTDECYEETKTLICPLHGHTDDCYTYERTIFRFIFGYFQQHRTW